MLIFIILIYELENLKLIQLEEMNNIIENLEHPFDDTLCSDCLKFNSKAEYKEEFGYM